MKFLEVSKVSGFFRLKMSKWKHKNREHKGGEDASLRNAKGLRSYDGERFTLAF